MVFFSLPVTALPETGKMFSCSVNSLKNSSYRFSSTVSLSLIETISQVIDGNGQVATSIAQREQHSHDEGYHKGFLPDVVIWPTSTEQVSKIIKICNEERISVVPFGTGTGLEGGVNSTNNGVCINLTMMNQVKEYFPNDFHVTVEPGVTRTAINKYVKESGLWFPVDPGADASLCGMAATSASGTNAVKYGTMKDNVINMEVVLPSGEILHTNGSGRRFCKTSAGYYLNDLFIGSEGTLGVITSATLRLHGIPENTLSAVCHFDSIKDAVDCTVDILQYNVDIARVELLDSDFINAVNKYSHLSYCVKPTLFLEFHGSEQVTNDQINITKEVVELNNGSKFEWASDLKTRNILWKARHDAYYAFLALEPGCKAFVTDVCLPISNLSEAIQHARNVIDRHDLLGGIIGHVGDGNFHCVLNFDPNSEEKRKKAIKANEEIVLKALELNGTCTGEHGVGLGKKNFLVKERGNVAIDLMKKIKCAIDPNNIMNPGKIL